MAVKRIVVNSEYYSHELKRVQCEIAVGMVVDLTPEQASRRKSHLRPICGNRYEVIRPIEFKLGEEFGIYE